MNPTGQTEDPVTEVAVLCPLYKRVYHLPRLSRNLAETTPGAKLYLRVVKGITPTFPIEENMRVFVSASTRYPHGINELGRAAKRAGFDWLFIGADDLDFKPGWLDEALKVAKRTGALVIGTNDLTNPRVMAGAHATHMLVWAEYMADMGTRDNLNELMSEAYLHNFVDDEIRLTAQTRGLWAHADKSHVEHLHPIGGKTEWDSTYERGTGGGAFDRDQQVFLSRWKVVE